MGLRPFWTNFTAGIIDELLDGRVDLSKYNNGIRAGTNVIIFQQGGIKGRPGLRFVAPAKFPDKKCRLIPFAFNVTQQYVLEFGHLYIRFFTNSGQLIDGGLPVEIASPYTEAQLFELKFTQSADILYIVHPSHPPKRLNRLGATSWTLTDFNAVPPPTVEVPNVPNTTLTLTTTTGTGVTVTAGAAIFLDADIGRRILGEGGVAVITNLQGAAPEDVIAVDILTAFPDTSLAAGGWTLDGSPFPDLSLPAKGPVNLTMEVTADRPAFRSDDTGKYIRFSPTGIVKVVAVNANNSIGVQILSEIGGTTGNPPFEKVAGTWTLESAAWSESRGYPRAIAFADQRLWFAGIDAEPDTLYGSKVFLYDNFARGTNDDDAVRHGLTSNQVNVIEWLTAQKDIIIGTVGEEHSLGGGGQNDPITPGNARSHPTTEYGSEPIHPCKAGRRTIFVQAGGLKLRAVTFNFEQYDDYIADDLTLLAVDICHPGIVQIGYEKIPVPLVWAIRSDGTALTLTYDPDQEVFAWAMQTTEGLFESVCPIMHPDKKRYQTWVSVNRTINGSTVRYIEFFDQASKMKARHPLLLDSALSFSGAPTNTVSNLGHLEGKTVGIIGDFAVYPDAVVTNGQVTLDGLPASKIDVGLKYIPEMETLRPAIQLPNGNIVFLTKGFATLYALFNNTVGAEINGVQQHWRDADEQMDTAVSEKTEIVESVTLGWGPDERIRIRQTQPLPIIIVAIQGELEIGEK